LAVTLIASQGYEPVRTFLFADLAGFTALTEAHGDEEAAGRVDEFEAVVGELVARCHGETVKTIGDAVMLHVHEPAEAVHLGLAIVRTLGERSRFPVVRVGIHTGTAVARAGDWLGSGVNVAARVTGAASGDEVLFTETTRELAGPLDGVEVEARGSVRLRNVPEPVRLFRARARHDGHAGLPIDPVCRMAVADEHCAGRLVYEGVEYCFCSLDCVASFARDPSAHLE
jgi:class 3 adenylate cyclase/YHS domain-containing protein